MKINSQANYECKSCGYKVFGSKPSRCPSCRKMYSFERIGRIMMWEKRRERKISK